jgi:hypothetical protein
VVGWPATAVPADRRADASGLAAAVETVLKETAVLKEETDPLVKTAHRESSPKRGKDKHAQAIYAMGSKDRGVF